MRRRHHPDIAHTVLAVNRLLRPRLALFDGTYLLDRNGRMAEKPVRMNLFVAATDIGVGSRACVEIMGIVPWTVQHFVLARRLRLFPEGFDGIRVKEPPRSFLSHQFAL